MQPGFDIRPTENPMGFAYGPGVFGPEVENRSLDAIRKSLRDPACSGPDPVYAIAMDVGRESDREAMLARNLLFGVVTYARGRLGEEPVRSQGHVHAVSPSCNASTPEVYEIWSGRAVILMQERDGDDPGRCFAVEADALVRYTWDQDRALSCDRGQAALSGNVLPLLGQKRFRAGRLFHLRQKPLFIPISLFSRLLRLRGSCVLGIRGNLPYRRRFDPKGRQTKLCEKKQGNKNKRKKGIF